MANTGTEMQENKGQKQTVQIAKNRTMSAKKEKDCNNSSMFTTEQKETQQKFSVLSYGWVQALIFALSEINADQSILPNVTLGFTVYDTCLMLEYSLQSTVQMLTGQESPAINYQCGHGPAVSAIIGDTMSTHSVAMARILGLFRHPQISYSSSSPILSDKQMFPSFVRTIPSDDTQLQLLAELLLHYMKSVHFKNTVGEEMYFDEHGNPPSIYSVINWQIKPDGGINYVKVGTLDASSRTGQKLSINMSAIQWNQPGTEVPRSVCSESCPSGFWKAAQRGQPSCCFNCNPCSEGEISNETDSISCWECPSELWPAWSRTECIPKRIEFLSYQEPLGATLTTVASLSSLSTAAILFVFLRNCDTAIVKANNREITYLLLGSIILSFLCSFLFIGFPQKITCLLRQSAFGIIFVLCVSCVLAKTIMVVIAFNATKPNSTIKRWLGPSVPVVTISVSTLGQVLLCAVWLLLCPPFPEKNLKVKTGAIIVQCNECSEAALWSMLGYLGFLACVSFWVAFLARNLPDSFNEAKWITFSMLVFLSVWLSFIAGYLSTQGKFMVAVEVFAIISSSAGLLICIFFPKCYIILLKPERNTKEHLLGRRMIKNK
ncbi:extracellular calcium-sensing receptor-like [Lissotriton helveticus]